MRKQTLAGWKIGRNFKIQLQFKQFAKRVKSSRTLANSFLLMLIIFTAICLATIAKTYHGLTYHKIVQKPFTRSICTSYIHIFYRIIIIVFIVFTVIVILTSGDILDTIIIIGCLHHKINLESHINYKNRSWQYYTHTSTYKYTIYLDA